MTTLYDLGKAFHEFHKKQNKRLDKDENSAQLDLLNEIEGISGFDFMQFQGLNLGDPQNALIGKFCAEYLIGMQKERQAATDLMDMIDTHLIDPTVLPAESAILWKSASEEQRLCELALKETGTMIEKTVRAINANKSSYETLKKIERAYHYFAESLNESETIAPEFREKLLGEMREEIESPLPLLYS